MMSFVPPAKFRPPADFPTDPSRSRCSGVDCAVTRAAHGSEVSLTVKPMPGEGLQELFGRLAAALRELDAKIVHLLAFGDVRAGATATEAMRRIFGEVDWPVTWVEGTACDGSPVAGLQVFAFAGGEVQRIHVGGQIVGSVFEDGAFRHCLLGGVGPGQGSLSRTSQTQQTFDHLTAALAQGGFAFADVVRTWFFLDGLLGWYDEFNQVRTRFYSGIQFRTGALPASTGVGGRNPVAAALVAGAWALQPLNAGARIEEIASPLQCPAPAYGRSFSRAMEMASPAGRRLFISGTASIAPDGRTRWPGQPGKQVELAMDVVEAILHSRGFTFSDLTRGTAYFKDPADAGRFATWRAGQGLTALPVVTTRCDVCRDDLLFEFEADAWKVKTDPGK